MLLDNKTTLNNNEHVKVFDFLRDYTESGSLDIVTGYFSISALAKVFDDLNTAESFKMILGSLLQNDGKEDKIINLLSENISVQYALNLSSSAKKAIEFLTQEKVLVKTVQRNFCHAKTYVYKDEDPRKNYHIIGSSNLTDAGLGLKQSSNIELNTASTGNDNDFQELTKWFEQLWIYKDTVDTIELPDKTKIHFKEYIIKLIQNLYREYSPYELYYKVLYELFKEDLQTLVLDSEFRKEISYLEETILYKTLFSFQQKGVISLIKMLQKYNGAILADAVGLGKTWTALAVMKYFEIKGYKILLLCPKKLDANWRQYIEGHKSKFELDRLHFTIRYHTDLQEERLENYQDGYTIKRFFQDNPKLLIVIDESHNLRNDKSARYKFLVETLLNKNKDVKVLELSATPINNKLIDVRNQFKLIVKGEDGGFSGTDLEIKSLQSIFTNAQKDFKEWSEKDNRKISEFITSLPPKFFSLTDALIVARTRKLIANEFGSLTFPKKEKPINEYINPENIGNLKTFEDILDALKINLTAYRPSEYIEKTQPVSVLEDPKQREKFLAKMMYILLMKRLESSWYSFKITVENILNHHHNALEKVNQFIATKQETSLEVVIDDEETKNEIEEIGIELSNTESDSEQEQPSEFTLGKKNPVSLSAITDIPKFKEHLEKDITKLELLKNNLELYAREINNRQEKDAKLEKVITYIEGKQKHSANPKVIIFTVFKDTAQYIFSELKKRGFANLAYVSGSHSEIDDGYSGSKFEEILERFAPFTKLFSEKDWDSLYEQNSFVIPAENASKDINEKWQAYLRWKEFIKQYDKDTHKKLERPIDILIATDCLSEGQNLQDCDCVINYDIHWNPVRLIQRMGRIDRLGSPNVTVQGINFWPGKNYEDFLNLKKRVEARMAMMTLVGAEVDEQMTPEMEQMVKDNPLVSKQTEKMLEQLQFTWDDVETSDETFSLDDLSLEQFRQELLEIFQKNRELFEQMPNGIFTGFKTLPNDKYNQLPKGVIALLGYPRKPDEADTHTYTEYCLLYANERGPTVYKNEKDLLTILRLHKNETRFVPKEIENGEEQSLKSLSDSIKLWMDAQVSETAVAQIQRMFTDGVTRNGTPDELRLEEKFTLENFDLVTWFVVSK